MEHCNELKKEMQNAIKQGFLKEFIDDVSQERKFEGKSFKKSFCVPKEKKTTKLGSSFGKMKVINVIQDVVPTTSRKRSKEEPFDDPLVVTMLIDHCLIKRILADTGSFTNILFKDTFLQMEIPRSRATPYIIPLVGFTGQRIHSKRKFSLLVNIGNTAYMVEFLMFLPHLRIIAFWEDQHSIG